MLVPGFGPLIAGLAAWLVAWVCAAAHAEGQRPNLVLIMTDDQGYGDLGAHGNPVLRTPALDRLHAESLRLTRFHVDPTGAPTRAAVMTGRYAARTGVWYPMMGRSLLRAGETTVAEVFREAGYRTGIFGKWHLGDNYPYRAMDRGFDESLVHGGGGIGHTPDYWDNTYFDPVLLHNGTWRKYQGYCTDVFFRAAVRFIEADRQRPFFAYLPANVPRAPFQVPPQYAEPYLEAGVPRELAQYYGMIANFDENLGRLLQRLDELHIADNTVVVFLIDNGTSGRAGDVVLRGGKGSPYDGGHRVPCFIRFPRRLKGGRDIPQIAAHIDLFPTLLDLCDLRYPKNVRFDGTSLVPLLVGLEDWFRRTLFVQAHGPGPPQPWRNSAVMTDQYRLVNGTELYDIVEDPGQQRNIGPENPEVRDRLRFEYEEWYKDVSERFDEMNPIALGAPQANPTVLTGHDWHGPAVPWHQSHVRQRVAANGYWAVAVVRAGRYRLTLRERPAAAKFAIPATSARVQVGERAGAVRIPPGATGVPVELDLPAGRTRLQTWLFDPDGTHRGAYFVEVAYLGPPVEAPDAATKPSPQPADQPDAKRRPPSRSAYD